MNPSTRMRQGFSRLVFRVAGMVAPRATGRALAERFLTPQGRGRPTPPDASAVMEGALPGTLAVGGAHLATYQWGHPATEPYILLSHGWSSNAARLSGWVPGLLALGFAVVAFDQHGHGQSGGRHSSLPDFIASYTAVVRHFGRPSAVVGHSMGATAAVLGTAPTMHPARVVLIAPLFDIQRAARLFVRMMGASVRVFPHFERAVVKREKVSFNDLNVGAAMPAMASQLLVIHDRRDRETPWEDGQRFATLWPDSEMVPTEGLGHNRLIDSPAVIDSALAFLARDGSRQNPRA